MAIAIEVTAVFHSISLRLQTRSRYVLILSALLGMGLILMVLATVMLFAKRTTKAEVVESRNEEEVRTMAVFRDSSYGIRKCAISPDGNSIVTDSSPDLFAPSVLKRWDVRSKTVGAVFRGHQSHVLSIAFNRDGTKCISASADHTAIIWDSASAVIIHRLQGHTGQVMCAVFSADSKHAATGSRDDVIKMWNVDDGHVERGFRGHTAMISSLHFTRGDALLVSGSADCTVKVWDVTSGDMVLSLSHPSQVTSIAVIPGGRFVAAACGDIDRNGDQLPGGLYLWDLQTSRSVFTRAYQTGTIHEVISDTVGSRLATLSDDGVVIIWDTREGKELLRLHTSFHHEVSSIAFSPNGERLFGTFWNGTIKMWDIKDTLRE
jgi:WD40 repeat protein